MSGLRVGLRTKSEAAIYLVWIDDVRVYCVICTVYVCSIFPEYNIYFVASKKLGHFAPRLCDIQTKPM